jgi:pimeloyl-ACP methyl ester carboxylesterase
VDARDRLYLSENVPTLLVWGGQDRIIPVAHGRQAHELMPHSRLEIFEGAGHFPFNHDPQRFIAVLEDFIDRTEPAELDEELIEEMLRRGPAPAAK